jgi:cytochrome c553
LYLFEAAMNSVQRKVTQIAACGFLSVFFLFTAPATQAAGNLKAGHEKARMCEACHGLDGQSKIPEAPNLAGQIEGYLVTQLLAFKSGERKNEQMSVMVQALLPQDIENVAAYYSAIEVKVGKLPGD